MNRFTGINDHSIKYFALDEMYANYKKLIDFKNYLKDNFDIVMHLQTQ